MDDTEKDAALAALTTQMFAEAIATGEVVVTDPEPAATTQPPTAVAPTPAAPAPAVVEPVAAPEPPAAEDVPTFKPKLSDELQALIDEPDFEEEARTEVAAEVESDEYEYADPETVAANRAKDKRIQFLESQLIAKSKKGWVEEAKRGYPDLARWLPGRIEGITASSRRAFIREADRLNAEAQQVFGPTLAKLEADRAAIAAGATAVAREEVANAWGKPAANTLPPVAAAQQEALERARAAGDLEGSIKVLMENTPVL